MTTRTYDVPGISCGHCKTAIETEVGQLTTVTTVDVDIDAKSVRVEGEATEAEVTAAIDEAGYDVAAVS
ncbi:cation transporter [Rhabdothermincola salaria]|uniref:cation transporter n=1 Tax=Rhabdothermincola salaria TaxID=2903142 RepID=UPI001E659838|nr:cation transporter [Rhabdothermincola salaria]MCD9625342.1 cation transporter [Rhabdothermincola salaria]